MSQGASVDGVWLLVSSKTGCATLLRGQDAYQIDKLIATGRRSVDLYGLDATLYLVSERTKSHFYRGYESTGDAIRLNTEQKWTVRVCVQGKNGYRLCSREGCRRVHKYPFE
jgi:hypothetical protein